MVKKTIQLYETMLVRHGVMLVGPTGGGKTTCYEVCISEISLHTLIRNFENNALMSLDVDLKFVS